MDAFGDLTIRLSGGCRKMDTPSTFDQSVSLAQNYILTQWFEDDNTGCLGKG
jgi:hypothetical protein